VHLAGPRCLDGPFRRAFDQTVITIVYPAKARCCRPSIRIRDRPGLGATRLEINGVKTELFDSGAFLGWIPVKPGRFVIRVEAANARGKAMAERVLEIGQPRAPHRLSH